MSSIDQAFETAFAHHRAGRFVDAATIYRQILEVDSRHADALHLLGVATHQAGNSQQAVTHISRAIMLRGGEPAYHSNLGEVYRALGKLDEAVKCYRQALRLNPAMPESHNNLGLVLKQQGDLAAARAAFAEALRLKPDYAEAHNNMGLVHAEQGDIEGAIGCYQQALAVDPSFAAAYDNLATTCMRQGRPNEGVEFYRAAMARNPANANYPYNLGVALQSQSAYEPAAAAYREAIRLSPRFSAAYNNLGTVLKELGQFDAAIECYQVALQLRPDSAEAYYNIGVVESARGRDDQALAAYTEALKRQPNYVRALVNFGGLIERRGRLDEALACYDRVLALEPELPLGHFSRANILRHKNDYMGAVAEYQEAIRLKPDYGDAYNNLAVAFSDLGQPDSSLKCCQKGLQVAPQLTALYSNEAIALFAQGRGEEALAARRKAMALRPDDPGEHSNYVYDLNFVPGYDAATVFSEHLKWAALHAEPLTAQAAPHPPSVDPVRRLKVGYVSPYFRVHAVNYFTEPVLLSHDHSQFEIFCYSDVLRGDATTQRLRGAADCWRDVYGLSDEDLAQLVRKDQIDILVDLTGHIGYNRLPAFARKPAPIQVTYIGYQNTTGMTAMDYRLTDAQADPPGMTDPFYTEKLVRLAPAFFCYRPPDDAPPVSPSPALERGYVTFGSFNKFAKVTPAVIAAWLNILRRVPDSRLVVLAYRGGFVENRLHVAAASKGIDPLRIELFDKQNHADYMRLIAEVDVALDPFPFNGHTTTCDAAWMGVPVVTLAGETYVTRFGSSVHVNVGLNDWIARSVDEYLEIAVQKASDTAALSALRGALRERMAASPLLDFAGFTRSLEAAYRQMWRARCAEGTDA